MARKVIAQNRKARHEYTLEDRIETGIMLTGTEVKSLRKGRASIQESYASDENGTITLINAHIPEYPMASRFNHDPRRSRKLLLHKRQIRRLLGAISKKGVTLIPLSLYFNERGLVKCELGIAQGKKKYEKREAEKERDWKRQKERILKDNG